MSAVRNRPLVGSWSLRGLRVTGHKLRMTWNGESGVDSASTGYCACGWEEDAGSQDDVRSEYRFHLLKERAKLVAAETGERPIDVYQEFMNGTRRWDQ